MQQRFTDKTKGLFNGRQRQIVQFRSFAFLKVFYNLSELVYSYEIKILQEGKTRLPLDIH